MKKTYLITGATKGIGLAVSQMLADNGAGVIGIARHTTNMLFPGDLVLADLGDLQSTNEALRYIHNKYIALDGVVNNVGIALPEMLGQISLENFTKVYELNVRAAVQIVQSLIEKIKQSSSGRIVNISSSAVSGLKGRSSYVAAKSALMGLTRTWALELAQFNVTVNAVAPGPVETELYRKTRPHGLTEDLDTLARIPLSRVGLPHEIASAVCFLLSQQASYITGQTLFVDGGVSCRN